MAAGTLDASAKIYAVRVDAVHSEAYKMLGGLGREAVPTQCSDADDSSLASSTAEKQKQQKKKMKKKKHMSSNIEENLSNITLTKLDVVEPHLLLDKAASSYDEQGAAGLFMNTLECSSSSWQLLFASEFIPLPVETTTVTPSCSSTNDLSDIADLFLETSFDKKELCPSFAFFTFSQSDEDEAAVEKHMVKSSQLTFNPNIEPYFLGEEDNGNAEWGDHVEGDGDEDPPGDDFGDECKAPWAKTAPDVKRDVMSVADVGVAALSQKLALNPGEYSYFNPKVMEGWVGPDHWTLRPFRKPYDQTRKKPKKVFELDFNKDADFEEDFRKPKAITVICKSTLLKHSTQATTLPDDLHYDPSNFLRLYLKPSVVLKSMLKDQVEAESDEGVQEYNFNNTHDAVNFCPDLQQDAYGEDDDIEPSTDGTTMFSSITSTMLSTFNRTDFPSWKLVDEPRKVDKIHLHYARKEKKIDMKKLKELMWDLLLTGNEEKENVEKLPNEKQFSRRVDFREMCDCLPYRLPRKMSKELSVPLAFVSLLHLANEKNLRIHGQEDMCSCIVEQDTSMLNVV
uniref:condensin complex subunit 2-like isoform X1 n=1 Tax=Myxine glutinosa TaxID=7769 RepID=UPI003590166D